jgi:acetoin utilization deacetylase AcuC-like enzyme/ankyrin repeat protein
MEATSMEVDNVTRVIPSVQQDAGDSGSNSSSDEEENDYSMQYLIHDLVEQGDLERLEQILPTSSSSCTTQDDVQLQMQVMSAESMLLEKDEMGCLPLHIALIYQRKKCFLYLMQYSSHLFSGMVHFKCADTNTPFFHLILRVGALNSTFINEILTEIFSFVQTKNDLQALLFEKIKLKDEEGNSVWNLCAMYDLSNALQQLMTFFLQQQSSSKDQVDQKDQDTIQTVLRNGNRLGLCPLHSAMKFSSLSVLQILLKKEEEEQEKKDNSVVYPLTSLKQTPLHLGAQSGFYDGIELFLKSKRQRRLFDVQQRDIHGYTAAEISKKCSFPTIYQLFLREEAVSMTDTTHTMDMDARTIGTTTRFYYHSDFLQHLPMASYRRGSQTEPPPENPERINTLVDPLYGILYTKEFQKAHISWKTSNIPPADIADILRVHEYHYVNKMRTNCQQLEKENQTFIVDPDTALSRFSYEAAIRAAGTVCTAIEQVIHGEVTNAFCIVRPPGHHVGPVGKVTCSNDPEGSHGFCVLNNVAIGAAYARSHFKRYGIDKIAIIDFDVHHGNGTEEIIRQLVPSQKELKYDTPYGEGKQIVHQYKPWRNEEDPSKIFFCSVHGYGPKDPSQTTKENNSNSSILQQAWFYPGSGETNIEESTSATPLIVNVGLPYQQKGPLSRLEWRHMFRDEILPRLMNFQPDLILLSSGFDAHKKENVNWGYLSLLEQDYEWLLLYIKRVANSCCQGRIVSILEGGYNFHGRMISPFARSVAAHARALSCLSKEFWNEKDVEKEAAIDREIIEKMMQKKKTKRHLSTTTSSSSTTTINTSTQSNSPLSSTLGIRSKRSRKQVDYAALYETIVANEKKEEARFDENNM